jgi:hypothetical protein
MRPQEVVEKALRDIEKGAIDASSYTEDMVFSGPVPRPMNRNEYVALLRDIVRGCPDWNFHARDYRVVGDTVKFTINITGTQTKTLAGIIPGMDPLPATNRHFILPEEHLTIKVRGDRISECVADTVPGGGVMGLLSQLGVQLKKAA